MKVVERVRVLSQDVAAARVEIVKHDPTSCAQCPSSSSCCSREEGGRRILRVTGLSGLEIGQEADVEMEMASPAWAAFLLLIVPMAAMLGGGLAAYFVSGAPALGFVGGGLGATAAYAGVHFLAGGGLPAARVVSPDASRPGDPTSV